MKHTFQVTLTLMLLFFGAQIIGLVVTNQYMENVEVTATGEINITWENLPAIAGIEMERPQVEPNKSVWLITVAVLIGTVLLLVLIRFEKATLWRLWFFLAVLVCLTISFGAFVNSTIAFIAALILAYIKLFKPGFIVQNLTEVFIYGGLAAIFVPILNMNSMILLLLFISAYDMYAVWKSKHMIKLAKFQTKAKIFAGMLIPYNLPKIKKPKKQKGKTLKKFYKTVKIKTALLGGGDIGFPLLFAGVVMKTYGIWFAMIIPVFTTISLLLLLMIGKKDKFYPAMPFLSVGCLAGFGAMTIIQILMMVF